MGLLQHIRAHRPVPFPEEVLSGRRPLSSVSLSCIQRAVGTATSVERAFNRDTIRPKRITKFDVPGRAGIKWLWLLDGDRYVVTLDMNDVIRCYDTKKDEGIRFKLEQLPDCWDFDIDEEGITIVVNGRALECVLFILYYPLQLNDHPQGTCHGHPSRLVQPSAGRIHRESTHPRSGSLELS
jgi:hypothetical protein